MEMGLGREREYEWRTGNVEFIAMSVWAVCCGWWGEEGFVCNPV